MLYVCLFWKAQGMKEVAILVVSERFFLFIVLSCSTSTTEQKMEPLLQFLTFSLGVTMRVRYVCSEEKWVYKSVPIEEKEEIFSVSSMRERRLMAHIGSTAFLLSLAGTVLCK